MKMLIRHILFEKGLLGLLATTWGFTFGEAILLGATAILTTILGAGTLLSEIITGMMAVFTLPILLVVIKQEWDEPQVKSIIMFLAVFVLAVIFSILLPFVIAGAILREQEKAASRRAKEASRSYRVASHPRNSGIEHITIQIEATYRRRVNFFHMRYGI